MYLSAYNVSLGRVVDYLERLCCNWKVTCCIQRQVFNRVWSIKVRFVICNQIFVFVSRFCCCCAGHSWVTYRLLAFVRRKAWICWPLSDGTIPSDILCSLSTCWNRYFSSKLPLKTPLGSVSAAVSLKADLYVSALQKWCQTIRYGPSQRFHEAVFCLSVHTQLFLTMWTRLYTRTINAPHIPS